MSRFQSIKLPIAHEQQRGKTPNTAASLGHTSPAKNTWLAPNLWLHLLVEVHVKMCRGLFMPCYVKERQLHLHCNNGLRSNFACRVLVNIDATTSHTKNDYFIYTLLTSLCILSIYCLSPHVQTVSFVGVGTVWFVKCMFSGSLFPVWGGFCDNIDHCKNTFWAILNKVVFSS